ncbi:hypothetical protein [Viscerimonas tarda]
MNNNILRLIFTFFIILNAVACKKNEKINIDKEGIDFVVMNVTLGEEFSLPSYYTLTDISLKNRPCRQGGTQVGKIIQTQHYK